MKFNVIVGNPPYQDNGSSHRTSPHALYPAFVLKAVATAPDMIAMIIPSRWAIGSGLGVREFQEFMFNTKHLSRFVDICNPREVFRDVTVRGGVCYFLLDLRLTTSLPLITVRNEDLYTDTRRRPLKELRWYIRYPELIGIIKKFGPYKPITDNLYSGSGESIHGLKTNTPTLSENGPDRMLVLGKHGSGYLPRESIKDPREILKKYKVLVPTKGGGPGFGKLRGYPRVLIALPDEAFTGTYQCINAFNTIEEAENCKKYLETNLMTATHGACRPPVENSKGSFWALPTQDFTQMWSGERLYSHYGLTDDEVMFIEGMVAHGTETIGKIHAPSSDGGDEADTVIRSEDIEHA